MNRNDRTMSGLLFDFSRFGQATRTRSMNWRLGSWIRKDSTIQRAVDLVFVEILGEGRSAIAVLTAAGKREAGS